MAELLHGTAFMTLIFDLDHSKVNNEIWHIMLNICATFTKIERHRVSRGHSEFLVCLVIVRSYWS